MRSHQITVEKDKGRFPLQICFSDGHTWTDLLEIKRKESRSWSQEMHVPKRSSRFMVPCWKPPVPAWGRCDGVEHTRLFLPFWQRYEDQDADSLSGWTHLPASGSTMTDWETALCKVGGPQLYLWTASRLLVPVCCFGAVLPIIKNRGYPYTVFSGQTKVKLH